MFICNKMLKNVVMLQGSIVLILFVSDQPSENNRVEPRATPANNLKLACKTKVGRLQLTLLPSQILVAAALLGWLARFYFRQIVGSELAASTSVKI